MTGTKKAFWDTSAVVPLCTHERQSSRARQILRAHKKMVMWWETFVEAHSAFNRTLREGTINQKGYENAVEQLIRLCDIGTEIPPDEKLRMQAVELLESYPLRTGDALQLAAALIWCKGKPHNRVFVCFDLLLADVAAQVGFSVLGLK